MPTLEHVHTLRILEVKQTLEAGKIPVEVIARNMGFCGRLARRKERLTPAQYRRVSGDSAGVGERKKPVHQSPWTVRPGWVRLLTGITY